MKRLFLIALLALAACKEEQAGLPAPVPLTEAAVGYFCQMNVVEHPGPKGQAHLDGQPGRPLFFNQVRDTIAFMRMPERDGRVLAVYVSDMGAAPSWEDPGINNWTLIDKASFVVGSDADGGMGTPEIVPFADPAKAQAFAARHGGKVMALKDIPDEAVFADGAGGTAAAPTDADPDYLNRLRDLSQKLGAKP